MVLDGQKVWTDRWNGWTDDPKTISLRFCLGIIQLNRKGNCVVLSDAKYTKALIGKNCLSSHSCHFVNFFNQTPSCICSMCLYCEGKVSNCSIRSRGRSWLAHEGTIITYTKVFIAAILSKIIFLNQTPSCLCSMCLYCEDKVSNCSIKSSGRSWSVHEGII